MADTYKINYENNIFEYPESTKIHREPTAATLLMLKTKEQAPTIVPLNQPQLSQPMLQPSRQSANHITKTIPEIFDHLLDNYGDITPEELCELKAQMEGITYSPATPMDILFSEIEELAHVAEFAKSPTAEGQKMTTRIYY
eukprot:11576009-Ditylum_brightwellii.AAC.1